MSEHKVAPQLCPGPGGGPVQLHWREVGHCLRVTEALGSVSGRVVQEGGMGETMSKQQVGRESGYKESGGIMKTGRVKGETLGLITSYLL